MRLTNVIHLVGLGLVALALLAADYRGQVQFGGLPLPGVTVTATQGDQTLTAVSDPQGTYWFADLPDGNWSLEAAKPGFSAIKKDVTVGSALPAPTFEMKMLPLDQMQAVEMQPTAAPTPAAAATKPATAYQRTDLAAAATSPLAAAEPAPGVTGELTQRAADGFLINGSAINGASTRFAQAAAFGNARRGGRRLYTYALSFVDTNSALDAANFSLTGQHTVKPPFNNLTGTASFGGPLRIAHLLERNGPQFTVNYSRTENRNSRVQTSVMPDPAERAGDFSQTQYKGQPMTVYDPSNGEPFAGSIIPITRISSQAASLLAYYPNSNFAGINGYNYQVPLIGNTHTDSLRASLSQSFKRKNLITGLFAFSDTRSDNDSQFQFLDLTRSLGINSNASYRRTFTPRFFGQFTYQFSRQSTRIVPFFANRENVSNVDGITGNNQDPLNWGPPSLQFNQSSIAGLTDGTASVVHNQTSTISYTGSWNRHQHYITFGGDERWQQFNTLSQSNPRGTFTFSGAATGVDFADFLLGIPDASAIAFGNADKYLRATQPDLFFRDEWNVAPGVTLDLGLRWEYTSPITEKYGRLVNLEITPGFTAIAPVVEAGAKSPLIRPDYRELEPRIGVAWRPIAASSMVVRAGYGISYNTQVYQPFANRMVQQSPLSYSLNVANTAADPLTLANGFYAPPNVTTNTVAVDPRFKVGQAQNWNFIVQRDLPGSLQLVATYNGIKGTHQLQAFAPNTYPTGPVDPSGYVYYTSYGNSTRQAGTVQLRRRMHNGILAQVQYTYSKSIDDDAALGGGSLGTVAQNWLNLAGERGLSTFDQRHLANISMQYTSGMGLRGGTLLGGWRGRLLQDWSILDAITAGSGLPLTPIFAQLIPGTGIPGAVRASYTGASLCDAPAGYFLNSAAVTAPAAGQWGNAGVGSITGPGQFSMSASLQRSFRLSERFTLSLRVDANNPLNHVVVTQLNTTVTNPLFGLPLAVNAMRTITTTMRLTF